MRRINQIRAALREGAKVGIVRLEEGTLCTEAYDETAILHSRLSRSTGSYIEIRGSSWHHRNLASVTKIQMAAWTFHLPRLADPCPFSYLSGSIELTWRQRLEPYRGPEKLLTVTEGNRAGAWRLGCLKSSRTGLGGVADRRR